MTLTCPEYAEMDIIYANFGRTEDDTEVCSSPQEHNNDQTCFSNRTDRVLDLINSSVIFLSNSVSNILQVHNKESS